MAAEASAQRNSGADAQADTFPKLLIRNARLFGERPALRHKDFGIWQTWTWARLLEEVRAYAVGLHRLGVRRGDAIALQDTALFEMDVHRVRPIALVAQRPNLGRSAFRGR